MKRTKQQSELKTFSQLLTCYAVYGFAIISSFPIFCFCYYVAGGFLGAIFLFLLWLVFVFFIIKLEKMEQEK